MTDHQLLTALDPKNWRLRPLTKVFNLKNMDSEKLSDAEVIAALYLKFKEWTGQHLDKISDMQIETFYDESDLSRCIQVRFSLQQG